MRIGLAHQHLLLLANLRPLLRRGLLEEVVHAERCRRTVESEEGRPLGPGGFPPGKVVILRGLSH
jgi:hypothetical protein